MEEAKSCQAQDNEEGKLSCGYLVLERLEISKCGIWGLLRETKSLTPVTVSIYDWEPAGLLKELLLHYQQYPYKVKAYANQIFWKSPFSSQNCILDTIEAIGNLAFLSLFNHRKKYLSKR